MTTSSGSKTLQARLLLLAQENGLSKRDLERRCSLSPRFLDRPRQRLAAPTARKILRAFPGVSRKWLLCGLGQMMTGKASRKGRPASRIPEEHIERTLHDLGQLASGALAIAEAAVSLAGSVSELTSPKK